MQEMFGSGNIVLNLSWVASVNVCETVSDRERGSGYLEIGSFTPPSPNNKKIIPPMHKHFPRETILNKCHRVRI